MKPHKILPLAAVLLASAALPLTAQTDDLASQINQPVSARVILGSVITDSHQEKLGTLQDVAVDLENGRIVEVVIARSRHGVAGQTLLAVPPQSFTSDENRKGLCFNLDPKTLDRAPTAALANGHDALTPPRVLEVYQRFGVQPYFASSNSASDNSANSVCAAMGMIKPVTSLLRLSVRNHQDNDLGPLSDLILDFPSGRVVEVFVATGHFLGLKDELSALPPQALHFPEGGPGLIADATSEMLLQTPLFSPQSLPQIDAIQAGRVYRAFHVTPYFGNPAASAPENVAASDTDMMAALDALQNQAKRVENRDDKNITSRINADIKHTEGLSSDAHNVKVRTVNRNVTLTGIVARAEEKRFLEGVAARYAVGGQITSQIQIRTQPTVTAR